MPTRHRDDAIWRSFFVRAEIFPIEFDRDICGSPTAPQPYPKARSASAFAATSRDAPGALACPLGNQTADEVPGAFRPYNWRTNPPGRIAARLSTFKPIDELARGERTTSIPIKEIDTRMIAANANLAAILHRPPIANEARTKSARGNIDIKLRGARLDRGVACAHPARDVERHPIDHSTSWNAPLPVRELAVGMKRLHRADLPARSDIRRTRVAENTVGIQGFQLDGLWWWRGRAIFRSTTTKHHRREERRETERGNTERHASSLSPSISNGKKSTKPGWDKTHLVDSKRGYAKKTGAMPPNVQLTEDFWPDPTQLFEQLRDTVNWDKTMSARLTASCGTPYNYRQMVYPACPIFPALVPVQEALHSRLGVHFNNCLLNYYLDGRSKMGFHSDDTSEWQKGTGVAIVSIGGARRITFRQRNVELEDAERIAFELPPGSLLYMSKEVQDDWAHAIKRQNTREPRISLTWRAFQQRD